jgi:subtilisin family serine protease
VDVLSTFKEGEYALESGTSQAAPHVAGAAALYKVYHPLASPLEVMKALTDSSSKDTTLCNHSAHGYFSGDRDGFHEPLIYNRSRIK